MFSLGARDAWIGWNKEVRKEHLHHVMAAFVLGAVPPYSFLLCGKLIAMLATSNEVRAVFKHKYGKRRSVIKERHLDGQLALISTTSALGRSSLYNRLRYDTRLLYWSAGFTRGSGEFHFSNGLYRAVSEYAMHYCEPTAKQKRWGAGFRSRREIVKKCLSKIGLSSKWLYHGIQREIFMIPLAENAREFLRGEQKTVLWFDQSAQDLFTWFRERWLLPRAKHNRHYLEFIPSSYRLWGEKA